MPRPCSICAHPQREAIEKALVSGVANRRIASQFGIIETSLRRHRAEHLPQVLAAITEPSRHRANRRTEPSQAPSLAAHVAAVESADAQRGVNVLAQLERIFERVNKLFDACDEWLTDADHPERYDIGPRAGEVKVTYFEQIAPELMVRRKATLEDLLQRLHGAGIQVDRTQTRVADPRKLVLDTASQLVDQLRLLTDLIERVRNAQRMERLEALVVAAIEDADAATGARLIAALRSLGTDLAHPGAG